MNVRALIIASTVLILIGSIPLVHPAEVRYLGAEWIPVIDRTVQVLVPPGSVGIVSVSSDSIGTTSYIGISPLIWEAIEASPAWLQRDLAMKFDRMGTDDADRYAELILNTSDPRWLDEVAFVVAHSNVPTLTDEYFFPELIYDNARLIYETDPILTYVRIVEEEDYTTLAYIDGNDQERVLPRDIYYWYVVHPDLGDDLPTYVDPDYNYTTDPPFDRNYGVAPPTGVFWRDHLLNYNKTGKPLLKDALEGARNIREAIGAINGWVDRSMIFTSDQERPVQPVRIYEKGKGRCGEYQDMRSAAARIALIPVVAASNPAEDHVWNEFWDQRWVHWDGTVDNPLMYEKGWGKTISTVWDVRGDGYSWTVTERYSAGYSNLTVTVLDSNDLPADGVTVDLLTENFYNQDIKTTTASSSTTFDGTVKFTIGDDRNYWLKADGGSLGTAPINPLAPIQAITGSEAGGDYNITLRLPRAAEQKNVNPVEMTDPLPNVRIELYVMVAGHTTFGTSSVSGGPYDGEGRSGSIDIFLLDDANTQNYDRRLPIDGYNLSRRASEERIILLPSSTEVYNLMLANDFSQSTYEIVNVTVRTFRLWDFTVDSPAPGSVFELGSQIEFKGTFYTPYDHGMVKLWVEGSESGSYQAAYTGSSWSCELDSSKFDVGPSNVYFTVMDDSRSRTYLMTVVVKDSTAPSLYAAPLASTYKVGDPIPLSGSAFDLSWIRSLSLKIDESAPIDIYTYLKNDGNWSYMLVTDGLSPGGHDLILSAVDEYDNTASVSFSTTIVEGDPPELFLDEGIDGSLRAVRDIVHVRGMASDASGVASLRLTIDSKPMDISGTLKGGVFSYGWDTKGYSDGWHQLTLVASDPFGSSSQIDFRVLLDGKEPHLELTGSPEYAGPLTSLTITGKASDENGISGVGYSVDGGAFKLVQSRPGSFEFRIDTLGWSNGFHEISVTATDKAGNGVTSSRDIFYDGTPPEITIDPVTRIVLMGDVIVLTGSVQDETGSAETTMIIDGMEYELYPQEGTGTFNWTYDTTGGRIAERQITVSAIDLVGNEGKYDTGFRLVDERTDSDGDGMPDWWEFKFGLDPDTDGSGLDTDGDGVTDLDEYLGNDGRPGNDDWSDPTDDGSRPSEIGHGGFPFLTVFIILTFLSIICAIALFASIRMRRTH
jgi:hypothetical protein